MGPKIAAGDEDEEDDGEDDGEDDDEDLDESAAPGKASSGGLPWRTTSLKGIGHKKRSKDSRLDASLSLSARSSSGGEQAQDVSRLPGIY